MIDTQHWRKWIIGVFISVPILSSLISTYHLVALFTLGNPSWLSFFLALTFEAGSIASLLAIPVLEKVNKKIVWFVFGILFLMQVIGNVYFSFNWVSNQIANDPIWISSFQELFSWIVSTPAGAKIFLAWLIGLPIPMLGTLLSKSLVDYLKFNSNDNMSTIGSDFTNAEISISNLNNNQPTPIGNILEEPQMPSEAVESTLPPSDTQLKFEALHPALM